MRRYQRMSVVAAASLAVIVVAGATWAAQWVSKNDPNETEGTLDIKKAELLVPKGTVFGPGDKVKCRTVFYENPALEDGDHVECYFDIKGDQNAEVWTTSVYNTDTQQIEAALFHLNSQGLPRKIKNVPSTLNGDTLTVTIPRDPLRGRKTFLRWYQHSFACSDSCFDTTGNDGSSFKFTYRD